MLAQLSRLTDVGKKHTGPSTEFFKIVEFQAKNLKIIFITLVKKASTYFLFYKLPVFAVDNVKP